MGHGTSDDASQASGGKQASAKHKYFDDQFDNEEVLFVFRKHPIVMRKGLIISSVAVLVGPLYTLGLIYLRPNSPPSMTFFFLSIFASFVLAGILFLPAWIGWHFSVYIVTDQRFIQITQKGFFNRSVVDMSLRQIQIGGRPERNVTRIWYNYDADTGGRSDYPRSTSPGQDTEEVIRDFANRGSGG
jgi:hypothetical protein